MKENRSQPWRHPDFLSGACFVALGLFVFFYSLNYNIGSLQRMGPGFLPATIGFILAAFGATIMLGARRAAADVGSFGLRPIFLVLAAIAFWAFTIERLGLVISTFGLVFIAAGAADRFRPLAALVIAFIVTVSAYLVFIVALNMPIAIFWRSA